MEQVKFVKDTLLKICNNMVCVGRPYHFKFFKGCLPQILLGPFLNALTQLFLVVLPQHFKLSRPRWISGDCL